jgi:hypothetical protein
MRVGKIFSVAVVSLASLIVIAAATIAAIFWAPFQSDNQQNFAPNEGQQAISPIGNTVLFSQTTGNSSFLYRKTPSGGTKVRLTAALSGIESEASFSHDGRLVVYSFANSPNSKSAVWVVDTDGRNARAITGNDQDALHPVFSPDDSKVFYAASSFTGRHSPVVRPARHDWDLFSIPVPPIGTIAALAPTKITQASFYDPAIA